MSFSIASTLEKFTNRDKDFRCMACADLTVELGKETFKMDSNQEKQITNGIIKLLEDDHSQVQELAVKTLGPLSLKVPEAQVNDMIDNCARLLLTTKKGQEDFREIGNNGLKVIITAIPTTNKTISASLANRATLKLVENISKNESNLDIVYVSLDALNELLSKFAALAPDHEKLLKVIEPQLGSQRQITRKCAISCLGHLATSISDKLFASLVANLVKHVEGSKKTEEARTYIQAIGAISRSAGGRLGRFLEQIIPLISKYADGKDDDLREECFSCFELLVLKCPGQITPYISQTTDLALKYVKQENLVEEDDDEMDVEEGDDMEEDGDDEEEEGDGDDDEEEDDSTWKVRRASTKCLDAIISTHPELLPEIGDKIVVALVARFKKEREENVKLEVFSTFSSAVRHLSSLAAKNPEGPSANTLKGLGPKVVAALSRQLKDKSKSVKVRTGAFSVLKDVAAAIPGSLKDQVAAIVPGLQLALGDKATNHELRVQALSFLLQLFSSHEPSVIQPHVKTIAPLLNKAIKDSFGKTSAAGLRAGTVFVRVLRPEGSTFDFKPYVKDFFAASVHKLNDKETEQDVKESSITCTALIVANLGDELKPELKSVLTTLVERLSNEITAVAATKAFDTIASSKLKLDLSPVLPNLIKELLALVQKTNARQAALATLGSVIKVYGSDKAVSSHYKDLLTSVGPFVSEQDLQLAHYVLRLSTIILEVQPDTSAIVGTSIVTPLFVLLRSSVLQGVAVQSASGLLRELVKLDAKNLGFDSLLKELLKISQDKGASKTVLANVAKGVASVIASAKADKQEATIGQFVKDLGSKDLSVRYFALYSLGEVGTIDTSHGAKVLPLLYEHSSSDDEGTRQVVSESLGKLALAHPADVVASFQEHVKSKSAHTRSTVLGGLKYSLVEKPQEVDKVLQPVIGSLLDSIKDSDLHVRRNAVLALDAAVRYKASLVKSVVATHLGAILSETTKKPELVRTIDLGMMKHEVDEGLENRKSAFYLVNNLLDASFELGDLSEFVNNQLTAALKDTNDLKLLAYSTVSKLAGVPSGAESLRKGLEKLVEAFTTTVAKPVDPKKPEDALPDEIVRSGLVAVASLALIPGPAHPKLDELLQAVNKGDLKDKFAAASVQEETKRDLRSSKQ